MKQVLIITLFALMLSGCAVTPLAVKPELQDEGEIFVYLQPFEREARTIKFTIDACSLVSSDRPEIPLPLALTDIQPDAVSRQRFLATARVPPGTYRGLSCTFKKASVTGNEGEASLLAPEGPVPIPLTFSVGLKKAVVLSLAFHGAGSVETGFRFTPRFSLSIPSLPANGLLGYTANPYDNTLSVFDKKTGEVAAIIAVGKGPASVAFNQKKALAYVALEREDAVDVIDMTEGVITHRINLNIGDGPREILITPDGRFVLTLNVTSRTLSFLDPVFLAEVTRVPVGEGPRNLLLSPNGNRCYVFNGLSNTFSVIDIVNSQTIATISTDAGPIMGQFNRKGDRLYIIHEWSPYLYIIEPSSLSLTKRVFIGTGVSVIKVDTKTDLLYAYRRGYVRIEIYDPLSLVPGDSLIGMSGVLRMTIDGEANNLFLLSGGNSKLMSVSLISRKTVSETDTGGIPSWVTMMGER